MSKKYHLPLLPDKTYHLFNRAVGNDRIFKSNENYYYFLKRYSDHTSEVCDTYSYCLLPNHFHLFIRIKPETSIKELYKKLKRSDPPSNDSLSLSDFVMERFSNWLNGYTKAFNKQTGRKGSLFMDYTRRSFIETDISFCNTIFYIHKNPVHHGYVGNIDDWLFSSYRSIISSGPTKLLRNEVLDFFQGRDKFIEFHQRPINLKSLEEMEH